MPTAFANLQARADAVVLARTASATVAYTPAAGGAAGEPFDAPFSRAYIEPFGDIASTAPTVWCQAAQLADGGKRGGCFAVTGTPADDGVYEVAEPKPAGGGLTRFVLRKVS